MRLKSKKYVDNIDFAYDIEVKDNHNYTTNNVVVHNCKNPTSMQGRAILTLTNKAKYMVAMSGTPLMMSFFVAIASIFVTRMSFT